MNHAITNIGDTFFPELDGEAKDAATKEWLENRYQEGLYYLSIMEYKPEFIRSWNESE